jgi:hypothetical protein
MTRARARHLSVTGLAVGVLAAVAESPASAAPQNGDHFALTCGTTTYQVTTMGNGDYTPAHDLNSHKVFIPHAFGEFAGTVYDDEGNVADSFTEPASTQGSGKQKNDVSCTFTFTFTSDGSDPEGPPAGYTFIGTGSVTGQVAGH